MKWTIRKRGTSSYYVDHRHWTENVDLVCLFACLQVASETVNTLECAGIAASSELEFVPFALKYAPVEGVLMADPWA